MKVAYPVRVRVGVLFVIFFALVSNGLALRRTFEQGGWHRRQDDVSRYEARLQTLRSALPSTGVVGYLAEAMDPERYARRFYLTQYVLSPLIVLDSTAPELVIGNFRSPGAEHGGTEAGLVLVSDFGDGVFLFRHQSR